MNKIKNNTMPTQNELNVSRGVIDNIKKEKETKGENDIRLWTVGEILKKDFGKQEWLIEQLLSMQTLTVLSGNPGNYKTWLTIDIARSVASGEKFLNHFSTEQKAVLIIDEENHLRHLQRRFKQMGIDSSLPIHYLSQNNLKIDNRDNFKSIKDILKEKHIGLIIMDSLVRMHSGDENASRCISDLFDKIKQLISVGTNVIITHHHRKEGYGPANPSQSMRGSSDILASVDSHFVIKKEDDDCLVMTQTKNRQDENMQPFAIRIKKDKTSDSVRFEYVGDYDKNKVKIEEAMEAIAGVFEDNKKEYGKSEMTELLKDEFKKNIVNMALNALTDNEILTKRVAKHNKHSYSLKE